jgi:hypothetical protein
MLNVISWLLAFCIISTGIRYLLYFDSLFFHWRRYHQLEEITADDLKALPAIPFVKVQITTQGAPGSTYVVCRIINTYIIIL